MNTVINDFVLNVATVNGSGSQSSNNIILKTIFRMGIPVGGKNLFPSNIAGLPTWFTIRVNKNGFTGRRVANEICIAMNPETLAGDIKDVLPGGYFIYNQDFKIDTALLRSDVTNHGIPFRDLVNQVTDQIRLKKLLTNMIYVGIVQHLIGLDQKTLESVIGDQFAGKKAGVYELNLKAIEVGRKYASENLGQECKYRLQSGTASDGKIIVDGNTAAALGLVYGGCTFLSWYPITPSSSLAEGFQSFAEKYRKTENNEKKFAVVQAEDELSAIGMVLGASWAGARAMTATSGPGISLMSEFAGLSYYAEVPSVVWDIQRAGPSTGLPTRTQQADILSTYFLSHGDTKHVILLPANPGECFEYGQTCFDLAEHLQTMVFVLSDLDVGMNFSVVDEFKYPEKPFNRGKIVDAEKLNELGSQYQRYKDVDGDGIPYRTLPGTRHPNAGFLTRGSGHNEKAQYTEKPEEYQIILDRLTKKFETARKVVPQPVVDIKSDRKVGIIAFGSTDLVMNEIRDQLSQAKIQTNYLRIRALPLSAPVKEFIENHDVVYVVEQNRDAQMKQIITMDYPLLASKIVSIVNYDGMPIHARVIVDKIKAHHQ